MPEPTAEVLSAVPLGPEYIKQSFEIIETYFKNKRGSLMQSYGSRDGVTLKPDGSLLTPRDPEVENELKTLLRFANPNMGFKGEESDQEGSNEIYWVIDPIDSTRSFIDGRPYATNMIALVHQGRVICSVIYEFAADPPHMFTATNDGAFMDGQPLTVDTNEVTPTVWIDSKHVDMRNKLYGQAVQHGLTPSELPPPNGYRLTQFAQGHLGVQVYIDADAGDYDLLPGLFIAKQAGMIVRNIGSDRWDIKNHDVIAYASEADAQKIEPTLIAML